MPRALAKACHVFGCAELAPCPVHGPIVRAHELDQRRGSAASRGYDARWRAWTRWYFGELYRLKVPRAGLCGCRHPTAPVTQDSVCMQTSAPIFATLIDHIIPIRGRSDPRFYDLSNLQGLCERCHNEKRQRESRRAI